MELLSSYIEYTKHHKKLCFFQKYIDLYTNCNCVPFSLENINNNKLVSIVNNSINFINTLTINWLILGFSNSDIEMERLGKFLEGTDIVCHSFDISCDRNKDANLLLNNQRLHKYTCFEKDIGKDSVLAEPHETFYHIISYDYSVIHLTGLPKPTLFRYISDHLYLHGVFYLPISFNPIFIFFDNKSDNRNRNINEFGISDLNYVQFNAYQLIKFKILNTIIMDNAFSGYDNWRLPDQDYLGYKYKEFTLRIDNTNPIQKRYFDIFNNIKEELRVYLYMYNMVMMKHLFGYVKCILYKKSLTEEYTNCIHNLALIGIDFNINDIIFTPDYDYPLPIHRGGKIHNFYIIKKTNSHYPSSEQTKNLHMALVYILFCKQRFELFSKPDIDNIFDKGINSIDDIIRKANHYISLGI